MFPVPGDILSDVSCTLFIYFERKFEWKRGRERREEEPQADSTLPVWSPMWGSNSGTMRSWPELKSVAELTELTRCPSCALLKNIYSAEVAWSMWLKCTNTSYYCSFIFFYIFISFCLFVHQLLIEILILKFPSVIMDVNFCKDTWNSCFLYFKALTLGAKNP